VLRDNSIRVNRKVNSNLHVEQPALRDFSNLVTSWMHTTPNGCGLKTDQLTTAYPNGKIRRTSNIQIIQKYYYILKIRIILKHYYLHQNLFRHSIQREIYVCKEHNNTAVTVCSCICSFIKIHEPVSMLFKKQARHKPRQKPISSHRMHSLF